MNQRWLPKRVSGASSSPAAPYDSGRRTLEGTLHVASPMGGAAECNRSSQLIRRGIGIHRPCCVLSRHRVCAKQRPLRRPSSHSCVPRLRPQWHRRNAPHLRLHTQVLISREELTDSPQPLSQLSFFLLPFRVLSRHPGRKKGKPVSFGSLRSSDLSLCLLTRLLVGSVPSLPPSLPTL